MLCRRVIHVTWHFLPQNSVSVQKRRLRDEGSYEGETASDTGHLHDKMPPFVGGHRVLNVNRAHQNRVYGGAVYSESAAPSANGNTGEES